jgi:hypothetical protein
MCLFTSCRRFGNLRNYLRITQVIVHTMDAGNHFKTKEQYPRSFKSGITINTCNYACITSNQSISV